ncbi:hypothetical protein ACIQYS_07675 [Psychrobacillus sp. NPDC096426]|uniref:hypothetical protein n=1 Tax=Psychrobacillus sp. NPDC096426 TaxID=3364491 RepID=UPI0038283607
MNRQVIWNECQKVWKSPIFLVLIVVFSAFNIFLIVSNSYMKDELKMANHLADTYGLQITDESLRLFEQDIQKDVEQLQTITNTKFNSIYEFLEQTSWDEYNAYSEEDRSFFHQLELKEIYLNIAKNMETEYNKLSIEEIAEGTINMYGLSGKPAEMTRKEYGKLSERLEELKESGEYKQWAFAGKPYRMHSLLFRSLFKTLVFETLILIVLATAFITNYEFENKTHLLSYSTKRGRSFMKDKLAASLIISTTISFILLAVTLGTYFSIFDYAHLWSSSISSAFNWEYNLPYITWWKMPFIKFLLLVVLVLYSCMLLFSAIVFVISVFVKNSYFTFFIFAIFFIVGYLMTGFMPTSSIFIIIATYNLSVVVLNPHMLFSGQSGLGTMFQYFEVITIVIWTFIVVATSMLACKYFKKQDIQ